MKTRLIEIKTQKTVNTLELCDFINFLDDMHLTDKFRENMLTGESVTDGAFEGHDCLMNEVASRPDFFRIYAEMVAGHRPRNNWWRYLIYDGFAWHHSIEGPDEWNDTNNEWQRYCDKCGANDFEL